MGGDRFPEVFVYKIERALQERKKYMEEEKDMHVRSRAARTFKTTLPV